MFFRILSLLTLLFFIVKAEEHCEVFILHSYSQEYEWTKKQHEAFVKTFEKNDIDCNYYIEYLNTKRADFTVSYAQNFLEELQKKYSNFIPDLIYVTDDNALSFMLENEQQLFKSKKQVPVFFSGINDLSIKSKIFSKPYRGVYEVKEVVPNIELIKLFSPQIRDIYFVGDRSTTYDAIKAEILKYQSEFFHMKFHFLSEEKISELEKLLPKNTRSFVILTTIGKLQDDNGETLSLKKSTSILSSHKNITYLSMEDAYMHKGIIGGYMTSGVKQGEEAAKLAIKYMQNHSLKNVYSLEKSPNIYMFSAIEVREHRIILSDYLLHNSTIINQQEKVYTSYKDFLSIFAFILVFVLLLLFSILYVLQKRKNTEHIKDIQKLDSLRSKLYIKDQLIENIYKLSTIGFWRIDSVTEKLYLSPVLVDTLEVDPLIYKDDKNLLEYFIHPDDIKLYEHKLQYAKQHGSVERFEHRMISLHKKIYYVRHIIYAEGIASDAPRSLVGIIEFE